jgi:protein TonB
MPLHVSILDQPESLGRPLFGSVALHASVFSALLVHSWVGGQPRESWGDVSPGGGGNVVHVNPVKIPMPARSGIVNPLANDTESAVPKPPPKPKEEKRVEQPPPEAIPLKGRTAAKRPSQAASSRFRMEKEERSSQLHSESGQALVSPLIGQTGGGGVGFGPASPFGNRFGYYAELLRQKVAEKWRTNDVDPRLQTAPPVIVTFTLLRNGSVRDVRIAQRSGNAALDYSAQRAIYDASPFPELPPAYERNEAHVEFWFVLKR